MELNSLSKSFNMAGWRVGQLSPECRKYSSGLKVKSNMDSGMFCRIQQGQCASIRRLLGFLNWMLPTANAAVWLKLWRLPWIPFDPNSVGLFVWAKLNDDRLTAEAYIDELLYEKDIFITPMLFWLQGEGYVPFFVRDWRTNTNRYKSIPAWKFMVVSV